MLLVRPIACALAFALWSLSAACRAAAEDGPPPPPPPSCTEEAYRHFDFWIGTWEVFTPSGQRAGENVITTAANGCLLIENWQGTQGGTGQSYNFYNTTTQQWRQLWVSPGVVIDYAGGLEESAMVLRGHVHYQANEVKARFEGHWTPQPDGSVKQHLLQWNAETEKWDDWFIGIYRRKAAAP